MTVLLIERQRAIRACTRCVDAGFIPSANPILHGNTPARVMVIGQAPGPTAIERPLPFSGATGRTLQSWLIRAGFDDRALHDPDRFYLTSLTKCFPGKARSGAGDRAPGSREIQLCADHLDTELRLVRPDLILALGRLSISAMAPSLRKMTLSEVIGRVLSAEYPAAGAATVLPLPHPSGVSRWRNSPENQKRLAKALEHLATLREQMGMI